jgi:hypothetical protein
MIESYYVPIDPADLKRVSEILRSADVFTPTFFAADVDRYDPAVYLQQAHRFATDTVLRMDRNVFTRILALARGEQPEDAHRVAAAVVAFAQCAGIEIEPNMALYEVAHREGQAAAVEELALFRRADHAHPGYWGEIALGRSNYLRELPGIWTSTGLDEQADFTMPLRRWRRNYILCLKLAELELTNGSAAERLRTFIRWAYEEFVLGGPAIALAAHYLAPNAPRKRLLKGLRSPDRARALEGIRNAAWDVTLVSQWLSDIERQEESRRLVLLTSFDTAVHRIARAVGDTNGLSDSSQDPLTAVLCHLWGPIAGARLAKEIDVLYATRDAPERRINSGPDTHTIEDYIARGEATIRAWRPLHASS